MLWISNADWVALQLTLKLASISTGLLLLLCLPLAWWLARSDSRARVVVEALVAMPLVLPPTVIGFYLLIFLGPEGWLGGLLEQLGIGHLAFTFTGMVIGSMIYSLPFAVQPMQNAFQAMGERPLEVAATLRASPLDRFFTVVIPLARNGFLTAAVLAFAHTLGEFGVLLMIGGSIAGETEVASIAIYNHVEAMDYAAAHGLSLFLLLMAFSLLLAVYFLNRRFKVVGVA
ncbi:MAG: molybdate ABC transporter permease subunit [Halorhodospira halophila]|uniref:molybdate ABC transporter permease subunit n=1 Tax=Halorhodospira TaxID=85108 RepID=UPI001911E65A|nr:MULTISPECIES: molybdate ABC transporter permease subunit [Halorhodospira]MBK5942515.1 molybdenum ABC transporter permease subunit [Halorhodospira halophila]MCC3751003.1 molybdate ABC transporter permease subunit [Halorhodospira halophila]MCG5528296.1 molybdate ABC transporter permease subunit [Halorhodospira halophila]MCG5534098.1 molybdate ABC transporter permease subunit [Halorhodospira sp. 9621]MCG5538287.1 molybdate ABC transporter permease subunit [Halorhodospira sp. 9622]